MSNAAMTWGVKVHPGKGPKPVLMSLCDRATDHSGEDWTCFPSIDAIMEWTDYSRSAVERNLLILWRMGIISRTRRRRADGKLGIYDYTIHRDPETWALLALERADKEGIEDGGEGSPPGETPHGPDVKTPGGPHGKMTDATRQNDVQPYGKMTGQEPSIEPSREPIGAREPGDAGFGEVVAFWPESGLKRTSWRRARAAWAWACGLETADRLTEAVKACAVDPDAARSDFGWPGLHTWLSEERWRAWLPKPADAATAAPTRTPFAGPDEIAALVGRLLPRGRDRADELLQACAWREADRTILTRTSWAAGKLREEIGAPELRVNNLRIEHQGSLS